MGKSSLGNSSEARKADYSDAGYSDRVQGTIPHSQQTAFFQAEDYEASDIISFLNELDSDQSELVMNHYWSDRRRGFQSESIGPVSGGDVSQALEERLDMVNGSGYNVSIYDGDDSESYIVTAGISDNLPRSNIQRLAQDSPAIDYPAGGFTIQGNLDMKPEEIYEAVKSSSLQETRLLPRIDSAIRTVFQVDMR